VRYSAPKALPRLLACIADVLLSPQTEFAWIFPKLGNLLKTQHSKNSQPNSQ